MWGLFGGKKPWGEPETVYQRGESVDDELRRIGACDKVIDMFRFLESLQSVSENQRDRALKRYKASFKRTRHPNRIKDMLDQVRVRCCPDYSIIWSEGLFGGVTVKFSKATQDAIEEDRYERTRKTDEKIRKGKKVREKELVNWLKSQTYSYGGDFIGAYETAGEAEKKYGKGWIVERSGRFDNIARYFVSQRDGTVRSVS